MGEGQVLSLTVFQRVAVRRDTRVIGPQICTLLLLW